MAKSKISLCLGALLPIVFLAGCETPLPEVGSGFGIVTINGKPLNNAIVKFIPMADGLDGSHVSSGLTDENGKFELALPSGPGVYVGLNKVTISDPPIPAAGRTLTEEGKKARQEHKAGLLNRPIPDKLSNVGQTTLTFEVTKDRNEYNIEIKR